jgi:D-3-phosphoglycerate dehydrogenase
MYYYKVRGDVGTWEKTTRNLISSKKCLIIGCGNIGSRVYEKLMPFLSVKKYDVKYNSPSDLKRLVEEADIISVHIPLNEQTRGFFDSEKLSWIKNDAVIVNTSRGAVFEEKALYKRLMGSDIGAAFDVFWKEPYHGRLKDLGKDKFLMTPHTSSQTLEYVESGFKDILDIIKKFEGKQ